MSDVNLPVSGCAFWWNKDFKPGCVGWGNNAGVVSLFAVGDIPDAMLFPW